MSKELEVLERYGYHCNHYVNGKKDYHIIETALKALEILKDCCLVNEGFGGYELAFAIKKNITKEEYELLKEVLL